MRWSRQHLDSYGMHFLILRPVARADRLAIEGARFEFCRLQLGCHLSQPQGIQPRTRVLEPDFEIPDEVLMARNRRWR